MKVKIIKKSIKEGVSQSTGEAYSIKSLFVQFSEEAIYNGIRDYLIVQGATSDAVDKFCKPNEYNGKTTYAFGLNCSSYTFDKVAKFGVLDAKIIFGLNEKGFINAKIAIENRKEQIFEYEEPEEEADGWASDGQSQAQAPEQQEQPKQSSYYEPPLEVKNENPFDPNDPKGGLPF